MSSEIVFNPEELRIIEFKLIKGQIDTPEDISLDDIKGYKLENGFLVGFNLEDQMIKSDLTVEIKSESEGKNKVEASGSFHFVFIFQYPNLEDFVKAKDGVIVTLDAVLGNAIASVTYSTARGVLLTRLQGTALSKFILPIVNPNKLLQP